MRHHSSAWLAALSIASLCFASDALAVCTTVQGGEQTLQSVFNNLLGANAPDVASDCVNEGQDAEWRNNGPSTVTVVLELAGFANNNRFGIYDVLNPSNQFQLFGGSSSAGAQATVTFTQLTSGGYTVTVGWPNNPGNPPPQTRTFGSSVFGYYLSTPEDNPTTPGADRSVYFSQTELNYDGIDHLFAYLGNGGQFLTDPLTGQSFTSDSVLMAWEDLRGGGDGDYQDFIVYAHGVIPVPVPAALGLLISGLGLVGVFRRRRARPL